MLNILVVDDHNLVRQALAQTIDTEEDMTIVGQASNGETALALVAELRPDLVVMDINMHGLSGVETTRQITASYPNVKVLILTMYRKDEYIFEAIKSGANGYLLKDVEMSDLLNGIRAVARGEAIIDPTIATRVLQTFREPPATLNTADEILTEIEINTLRYLAKGLSNAEIATHLDVSEKTIRNRLSIIYRKLHINNRTEAALYSLREGLSSLNDKSENP